MEHNLYTCSVDSVDSLPRNVLGNCQQVEHSTNTRFMSKVEHHHTVQAVHSKYIHLFVYTCTSIPVHDETGDNHHECAILQSICAMHLNEDTHMQHHYPHPTTVQLHGRSYGVGSIHNTRIHACIVH